MEIEEHCARRQLGGDTQGFGWVPGDGEGIDIEADCLLHSAPTALVHSVHALDDVRVKDRRSILQIHTDALDG